VLHSQRPRLPVLGTKIAWVGNAAIQLAVDGEPILPGHFYLAPGGHNMRLERGRLRVLASPKEHLSYPSINALFRTAAVTYGPRVVGVILSGALNGGTAGLWEIKRRGGLAIVQVPVGAAAVGQ
jgi:two-component system chemotaxis response regulator CheB